MNARGNDRRPTYRPLFVLFLLLLVWAPIPLGSNRPWSWAILQLWVFLLTIWWLIDFARGRITPGPALRRAGPPLICAALWLAYVWLQLLPLPIEMLKTLSPLAARLNLAAAWPSPPSYAPLTLDRYATLDGALKSSAYVAFFALSLALLDRRARIAAAAYTLVISGFIQAMYAGVTALSEAGASAHGVFVNRNHLAGYLVMCLSLGMGLLVSELTGDFGRSWRQFARNTVDWILSGRMLLRLALVVMVIALVLTRSRMGNSSFFVSMLIAGLGGLVFAKRARKSMVLLIASLVVIDILIVGAYFGVQRVVDRIAETNIETDDRTTVSTYAIDMFKDYPAFGSGLGSFASVYLHYPRQTLGGYYNHAHNDYLEFACETGIVGIVLLGALVSMCLFAALRAQATRHDPLMRAIAFGAVMEIIALGMHSSVDFNLQIPSNALTFMLILAFAWVSLYHDRHRQSAAEHRDELTRASGAPSAASEPSPAYSGRATRNPA